MLAQRRRRWANINPALGDYVVRAGSHAWRVIHALLHAWFLRVQLSPVVYIAISHVVNVSQGFITPRKCLVKVTASSTATWHERHGGHQCPPYTS